MMITIVAAQVGFEQLRYSCPETQHCQVCLVVTGSGVSRFVAIINTHVGTAGQYTIIKFLILLYPLLLIDERDYAPLRSRYITMNPGISRRSYFTVNIINDLVVEGSETFTLSLTARSLPSGISINTRTNRTIIRIVDNDSKHMFVKF